MEVMKGIVAVCYGTVMTLHYISALVFIKARQVETEMKTCTVELKRSRVERKREGALETEGLH